MKVSVLPPILVAVHEHDRLQSAADLPAQRGAAAARFLLSELDRAILCPPGELPEDVVSMNCRVVFRTDGAAAESRVLVYPEDHAWSRSQLSVLSAAGAALLGLRVGDRMPYRTPEGARRVVAIERIDARPRLKILPFPARRRLRLAARQGGAGPDDPAWLAF